MSTSNTPSDGETEATSRRSVLVAEDDKISRRTVVSALSRGGNHVVEAEDGAQAWKVLQGSDSPQLAILDWMMPELDGLQLCREVKKLGDGRARYVILVTSKAERQDVVKGLEAGADDYITKPFDAEELRARVRVGFRVLDLQEKLANRVHELEQAICQIKQLHGLLPICSYCKKIRDDGNYWQQVEEYIGQHSEVKFSHGICPACYEKEMVPQLVALKNEGRG
ncbi:response regulator [Candidatus Nitronereus thalassa]|uniref:Response regulator n=1 Tax=Candidatus Nitronereus thalassa TaxID=3020898 RepID=A0ABU3K887_9BACT|nr:response regulator [Candidatus Nitronereus thalassa]MDT7042600.1 response regulator [Candidatus Nitronereus thalassa]